MRHCKAFTYKPKIEAVRAGECRQTIRPLGKRPVKVGDTILFHGWEGRPYWSKWSWRLEVTVKSCRRVRFDDVGMWMELNSEEPIQMEWEWLDIVAERDGIDPPTGLELKRILTEMHGLKEPTEFQIIRW